jgi:hypothetical protein
VSASLALHKEPEVAVGTMGIGLDYGGFGIQALPGGDLERILSAYPCLRMKQQFADTCCRIVTEKPETSHDNLCATSVSGSFPATKPRQRSTC